MQKLREAVCPRPHCACWQSRDKNPEQTQCSFLYTVCHWPREEGLQQLREGTVTKPFIVQTRTLLRVKKDAINNNTRTTGINQVVPGKPGLMVTSTVRLWHASHYARSLPADWIVTSALKSGCWCSIPIWLVQKLRLAGGIEPAQDRSLKLNIQLNRAFNFQGIKTLDPMHLLILYGTRGAGP